MDYTEQAAAALIDEMITPYVLIRNEGDLLYCKYADDLHLSLDVAKFCVETRFTLSKGKAYPLLIDMKGIKSTTQEAREYMASIGTIFVTAGALITGSPFNRMIGNIFLTINKPPVPTKLFNTEENARKWLAQFIN